MQLANEIQTLRDALNSVRRTGKTIAFVPTMGNLHEGHLSLIRQARQISDYVVASIFVNPMQFGANEDLNNYPRTLEQDIKYLTAEQTDCLFAPNAREMYPHGMDIQTQVSVPRITETLCGASRPGHFTGVATVVSKLFNIVQPDKALFGQKDFQQLAVLRQMTRDLCFPIDIISVPTCRAEDGLALSSRNGYLTSEERLIAPTLYATLQSVRQQILDGLHDYDGIRTQARQSLETAGFKTDYFSISDAFTLQSAGPESTEIAILVAASLGNTRLIDNVTLTLNRTGI